MKTCIVLFATVGLLSTLLADSIYQGQAKTREERNREFGEVALPILERADEKVTEARRLMKLKFYRLAEDKIEEALTILNAVPMFQSGPKSVVAEIRLLQGRYQDALDIWEELHPEIRTIGNPIAEYMEICYARTNQLEKGYTLFVDSWKRGCQCFHVTLEQMPVYMKPDRDSLEASALMLLVHNQCDPGDLEESAKRAERAAALAPKSLAANYCAGHFLHARMHDMVRAMPYFRKAYALADSALKKTLEKRIRTAGIKVEALTDPSIPIKNRRGGGTSASGAGIGG